MTGSRGECVDYVIKCFETGEVIGPPMRCQSAMIRADWETTARLDQLDKLCDETGGFETSEACTAAVAAATFEPTPARCA